MAMPKRVRVQGPKPIRLNLGCGANKLTGFVNIDVEATVKPDLVFDFVEHPLPYKPGTIDEIVLFHTIEHIQKSKHVALLREINRVLKPSGVFLISYPEWQRCAENWMTNYHGKKAFWEATLYGRQLFPSDYHVCIMHTPDFRMTLQECGFEDIVANSEAHEKHNTVVRALKGHAFANYEDLCRDDMARTKIMKAGA